MQNSAEESVQRMSLKIGACLLASWSNVISIFMMTIDNLRCTSYLPSEKDACCSLGTQEANSEEEMASMFGKEKSADTHFCQWLVSVSQHSSFQGNISTKNAGSKSFYHARLPESIYISCSTSEQRYGFSKRVKSTIEAISGTTRDAWFFQILLREFGYFFNKNYIVKFVVCLPMHPRVLIGILRSETRRLLERSCR